jgi:hypothetical protein
VRVRQYASFAIHSDHLSPDEITRRVGIEPDRVAVRGSKGADPIRPVTHLGRVESGLTRDLRIDDHLDVLVLRLWDAADRLREVIDGSRTSAGLVIVRQFGTEAAEEIDVARRGVPEGFERLSGQHPLLGFHLDERTMSFLSHINACVDVDEYGDDDG